LTPSKSHWHAERTGTIVAFGDSITDGSQSLNGRPETPGNRYFIEHVNAEGVVTATTNADWVSVAFSPSSRRPAAEIVSAF
jgi:hypothetical protein